MRRHLGLKRKRGGEAVILRQSDSGRSKISLRAARLRADRCNHWSQHGHTESHMLEAGDQRTTTES
jgi:hypothetical protein